MVQQILADVEMDIDVTFKQDAVTRLGRIANGNGRVKQESLMEW